jgi:hypothetical protein
MNKALAYIFLFIFSFQVLPVKQIGKILFKQLITEEIQDAAQTSDEEPTKKGKTSLDPVLISPSRFLARNLHLISVIQTAIHDAEKVPVSHIQEIHTPPPDFI